jgi:hypothetical protein
MIAPIAAMAVTAPTYNDSTKAAGSTVDKKPTLIPAGILTAMPATPMPAIVTGTANGDVNKQALDAANASASVKASYTTLVTKYNLWKTARTPVVTAYLAYKAAPAAQKAAKLKVYNDKLSAFNKAGGVAKYNAYKSAFTTYNAKFTPAYATAKNTVKANHFKLIAGTYGGNLATPAGLCTTAINMTATDVKTSEGVNWDSSNSHAINPGDGDPNAGDLVLRCNAGRIEYFLPTGPDGGSQGAWEFISATATVAGGKVTAITTATDATSSSLDTYTPYITNFVSLPAVHSKTPWTLATIPSSKKPEFSSYALTILNKSGAFDAAVTHTPYNVDGAPTSGQTCLSAATGATLTCLSYQYSLQEAINAAVKGMPY